jgi:hypothetical protein
VGDRTPHSAATARALGLRHNKLREATMTRHLRTATIAAAAIFLATALPASAQQAQLKYKPISVKTPDGVTISAQEWGNPNGPEILMLHGFGQSHLSWTRQINSDLAREFRIITRRG